MVDLYPASAPLPVSPASTPTVSAPPHKHWGLFLVSAVVLIGLGSFLYSWVFGFFALAGSLNVSLLNKAGFSTLYRYDLADASFTALFSAGDQGSAVLEAVNQPKGGDLVAFLNKRQTASGAVARLFNSIDKKVYSLPSDDSTSLKQNLSWSPNGKLLAYATLSRTAALGETSALSPDSWGIFLSDFSDKRTVLNKGVSPVFISDNRLLVVKDDGLYIFGLYPNDPGEKIWVIPDGKGNSDMSLAVSRDRTLLAWANPAESKVFIFKVVDPDTFELKLAKTISVSAGSPVFSPDGKFLALHEMNPNAPFSETLGPTASLVVYNVASLNKKTLLNLPLPSLGGISDWQENNDNDNNDDNQ